MTDQELETVLAAYELWNAGDVEGVAAACFSDDIEYQNSEEWPGQRTYRGSAEVVRFLREEVAEVIALSEIDIGRVEVHGHEILLELHARTHGSQSDVDLGKIRIFHVSRVLDGRVTRVRVFLDEEQATAAERDDSG